MRMYILVAHKLECNALLHSTPDHLLGGGLQLPRNQFKRDFPIIFDGRDIAYLGLKAEDTNVDKLG